MLQGRSWPQTLQVNCLTLPAPANPSQGSNSPALRLKHRSHQVPEHLDTCPYGGRQSMFQVPCACSCSERPPADGGSLLHLGHCAQRAGPPSRIPGRLLLMRRVVAECCLAPLHLSRPTATFIVARPLAVAHKIMSQVASQNFLSDAALEATLNNRADFADILADLGFVSPAYAAHCNSANAIEDSYGQDAMSGNARVIKAAICAGEDPSLQCIDRGNTRLLLKA